jgi:hypothetical protein
MKGDDLATLVFGDIPVPDGCRAYDWDTDDTGSTARLLSGRADHWTV